MESIRLIDSFYYSFNSIGISEEIFRYCIWISLLIVAFYSLLVKNRNQILRFIQWLLLSEYIIFIIGTTILFREELPAREFCIVPFWSYFALCEVPDLINENLLNVVLFIPLGLLGYLVKNNFRRLILFAFLFSITIEIFQFVFKKGFSEFDDVFHNCLGCAIGAYAVIIFKILKQKCISTSSKE